MQKTQSTGKGAALIALAGIAWSFSGMLSKWTPWGPLSIIGARALLATLAFAVIRKGFRLKLSPGNLLGAAGVMLSSVLFIIANKLTTAANAIVLQYAMPVVVILACWVFYHQKPTRLDISAAALTLFGVALCFMSGFRGGNPLGDLLAFLSAFTFAMVFFAARMPDTDPLAYSYLGNLASCVFLLAIPFDPGFVMTPRALFAILMMGICLTAGYLFFSRGIKAGVNTVTAAIVANVEPVLNPIWVFLVMGEVPGIFTFLGAALVLLSVTGYSLIKGRREALELTLQDQVIHPQES